MSNNAVNAYSRGLVPASKIRDVPAKLVRQYVHPEEWHHTSNRYNATDFYDPAKVLAIFGLRETADYPYADYRDDAAVAALIAYKAGKKDATAAEVYDNQTVAYLEWSGTRRHPRATLRTITGCKVVVRGITARVYVNDKLVLTKRTTTNGFTYKDAEDHTAL